MKLRTTLLAFVCSAAVLAACQGGSTYAPATATMNDAAQGSHFRAPLPAPFDKLSALQSDASDCDAPDMKIPGDYISMAAFGSQKGSTFTSTAGVSFWMIQRYSRGTKPTASPSAGPTASPTSGPTPKPVQVFFYTGTYTTQKTKQTGCAILFVTKNHKPIIKGLGSGIAGGNPQFSEPYIKTGKKPLTSGNLSLTITGLSASGGRGNAVLMTTQGKRYDTATFTLTKRISSIF
jgi:hypothetical protein